jgi:DNA-binding MarR family transcriptional regulator
MDRTAPTVAEAIRQAKPFRSRRQEGGIAILLTAEAVRGRVARLLAANGDLTPQQYNVLRILRGAGAQGLPTLSIVERMIESTPGITRLLDRLEAKKRVRRERSGEDRRQVVCRITAQGLAELKALDAIVNRVDQDVLGSLNDREVATLIRLLDKIRTHQP